MPLGLRLLPELAARSDTILGDVALEADYLTRMIRQDCVSRGNLESGAKSIAVRGSLSCTTNVVGSRNFLLRSESFQNLRL